MRMPSGVTDQYVYFVAVDSTDLVTRKTGLASFTVYRSRNGGAAAAFSAAASGASVPCSWASRSGLMVSRSQPASAVIWPTLRKLAPIKIGRAHV